MFNLKGGGNQYIQLVKALYCKMLTNGKEVPALPVEVEHSHFYNNQKKEQNRIAVFHS